MAYVKKDGTARLRLIAPGWGSSGWYSEDVLKTAAPLFAKGTKGFWDHPTAQEAAAKPEGSLSNLSHELIEDAKYENDAVNGPGLYANVKFFGRFKDAVNELGPHIGNSIRANGKVRLGEMEGKKGYIVEAISGVRSVDMVTMPGAKGRPIELFESVKTQSSETNLIEVGIVIEKEKETIDMADQVLQETINRLNARFTKTEAQQYARTKINVLRVKDAVKDRIITECVKSIPLDESGDIDFAKFDALIEASIKGETDYLTSVGAFGKINGFGGSAAPNAPSNDVAKSFSDFQESLKQLD